MALSWSVKRQLSIVSVVFIIVAVPLVIMYFTKSYHAPTCFDGIQNQDEEGIDCGGSCELLCIKNHQDLQVDWVRAFPIGDGVYSALGYIENDNDGAGIRNIHYEFKIYNKENKLITKREGSTFINPGERFALYEPRIQTGSSTPGRVFLSFADDPAWQKVERTLPKVDVVSKHLTDLAGTPRLEATIRNPQLFKIRNISVVAILYDTEGNALQTSSTFVDMIRPRTNKKIYYTWPQPIHRSVSRIELIPRMNIFASGR